MRFRPRAALTIIELLLTITVISVGLLPLIVGLANQVELLLLQKDQLSAISIGKTQMDTFLSQFQLIDSELQFADGSYAQAKTLVFGARSSELPYKNPDARDYRDIFYNGSFFRTENIFTYQRDLCSRERITYRIKVRVWKIGAPLGREQVVIPVPEYKAGDIRLFELASLYSQTNNSTAGCP